MHPLILEVIVPDGEPRIPPSLWDRPTWVMDLGIYGRAAYEWRRALAPMTIDLLDDPVTMFRLIDQTVSDRVRRVVQTWLRERHQPGVTVETLPQEFAEEEADQIVAATRAAEIGPCLELVYLPAAAAPGDLVEGTRPSPLQIELLSTTTWETRPTLDDLRRAARDLAETLSEDEPAEPTGNRRLTTPTALFPTELRVASGRLSHLMGRPVDLYLLFN